MNISPWNAANIDSHRHYGHILCSLMDFLPLFFSETHIWHTLTQVYNIRPYQKQGDYFLWLTWVIRSLSCIPATSRTDQPLFHPLRLSWDHLILYKKKTLTIKSCTCTHSNIFNMSLSLNYRVISVLFFIENDNNIVPISFCFTR